MNKFKNHLIIALAVAALAVIGPKMNTNLAAADTRPVVTIGAPVPLPVTGNVGITGTPNVNIANTPTVNLSGAAVANTAAAALFIVNQDSPGRIGYESVVTQHCVAGQLCTFSFGSVPLGHRITNSTGFRIHRLDPNYFQYGSLMTGNKRNSGAAVVSE